MRRSPMKRGKEADVSERRHAMAEDIRKWEFQHSQGGQLVAARRLQRAADTIQTLQQRCEELEGQVKTMTDVSEIYSDDWNAALSRIAELAEALKFYADTKSYVKGAPEVEHGVPVSEPLSDIEYDCGTRARQALSAREEPGEPPRDEGKREGGDG